MQTNFEFLHRMRIGAIGLSMLAFTLALSPTPSLAAATIWHLEITHDNRTYLAAFDVLLAANAASSRELLSDYRQWRRLSDTLSESQLLRTFPDGRQRIRLRFHACVLIFCKTYQQVKDVVVRPNGDIVTTIVPEGSDFASGWERWQIRAEQNKTRIQYHAVLVPAFRVPPLVGPWILKSTLRRKLIVTAQKLETLAKPVTAK
ncbi:MAG: hypothetical protein ACE5LB_17735 [Acidiferrobacterales bacterium]